LADDVAEIEPDFVLEKLIFPFETFLPFEATESQDGAANLTLLIPVRRRLDTHPMQLAVLPLYLDFETLGLTQERVRGRTIRAGRLPVGQKKLITDLAEQFFGRIACDVHSQPVGVKNPMVGINKNDRLGEAFKDGSVKSFWLCSQGQALDRLGLWQHTVRPSRKERIDATTDRCFCNE